MQIEIGRVTEKHTIYIMRVDDGVFNSSKHETLETLLQIMSERGLSAYSQFTEAQKGKLATRGINFVYA